jgi:hypothetical protein
VAYVKNGSTGTLYRNGVAVVSAPDSSTYTTASTTSTIGISSAISQGFTGYISNLRIVKGTAVYTGAFTPSGPLTNITNTSLLALQSNSPTGDTTGLNTITNNGLVLATPFPAGSIITNVGPVTTTLSTALGAIPSVNDYVLITDTGTSYQALAQINSNSLFTQTYSGSFNGVSQYLTVPYVTARFDWWTSDYTLECWVYPTSLTNWSWAISNGNGSNNYWSFGLMPDGRIVFWYFNGTGGTPNNYSSAVCPLNIWSHIALTQKGGSFTLFVNGVPNTPTAIVGTPQSSVSYTLNIGGNINNVYVSGNISNVRIVKGTALYTGAFTPTGPLANITNTTLLALQSVSPTTDTTGLNTITNYGVTISNTNVPSFTTTSTSAAGSYQISVPTSSLTNLNTSNTWAYQLWDPAVYQQSSWITNQNPTKPRDMLYYATLARGKYGVYFPNKATPVTFTTALGNGNINKNKVMGTNSGSLFYSPSINRLEIINSNYWTNSNNPNIIITGQASPKTAILYPVPIAQSISGSNVLLTFNNAISSINYMTLGATNYGVFNGSNQYLSIPASPNLAMTGDFTIECWAYYTTFSTNGILIDQYFSNTLGVGNYQIWTPTTGIIQFVYDGSPSLYISGPTLSINTWYHIAATRSGSTLRFFVNGIQYSTTQFSGPIGQNNTLWVGAQHQVGPVDFMSGYISNVRIIKGLAVYTGNFTPQGPLSRIQNGRTNVAALSGSETALLTLQNTTIIDNSYYNAITYISPTPTYYASFNGTSQYLTVAPNSAFAFGTGDFTIEYWIYWTSAGGSRVLTNRLDRNAASGTWSVSMGDTNIAFTEVVAGEPGVGTSFSSIVGKWVHIAICRISGTTTIYLNGSPVASGSQTTNFSNSSYNLNIGWSPNENYVTANISNVRIIKGQAVYTSNFTPSGPLTTTSQGAIAANVSLLTLQNATIIDNSTANGGVGFTVNNTTSVTTYNSPNSIITNVNTVTTLGSTSTVASVPPAVNDYLLLTDNTTSNQTLATIGSVTVSSSGSQTTITVPVQTYSVQFNGSSSYITTNASGSLGTQFTMEAFFYLSGNLTSVITGGTYWGRIFTTQLSGGFEMGISGVSGSGGVPTGIFIEAYGAGASYPAISNTNPLTIALNTWHHFAISRNGSNWAIWLDGINIPISYGGTGAGGNAYLGQQIYIGAGPNATGYYGWFNGYISNARIVTGSGLPYDPAIVTGNIAVPTGPLTAVSGTYLLTLQNATYIDNSTNTFSISGTNTTISNTVTPSFTTTGTIGTTSNTYILSLASSSVTNLNVNNSWTAQLWDPEVIPQAKIQLNTAPTNPRENLYWATLVNKKYGKVDSGTANSYANTLFYSKTDGLVVKYRTAGQGKGLADPSPSTGATSTTPIQFWN